MWQLIHILLLFFQLCYRAILLKLSHQCLKSAKKGTCLVLLVLVILIDLIIDALERFQLFSYLFLIMIRNFLEMTGGAGVDEILSYFHDISITIFTPSKTLNFQNLSFISSYFGEMFTDIIDIIQDIQISSKYKLFITLLLPALYVFLAEIIVDNLKHAFITKVCFLN